MERAFGQRRRIAVVGGGISGLSAAWLLSQAHTVTLFEADDRLGGHPNTAEAPGQLFPGSYFFDFVKPTHLPSPKLFRHVLHHGIIVL